MKLRLLAARGLATVTLVAGLVLAPVLPAHASHVSLTPVTWESPSGDPAILTGMVELKTGAVRFTSSLATISQVRVELHNAANQKAVVVCQENFLPVTSVVVDTGWVSGRFLTGTHGDCRNGSAPAATILGGPIDNGIYTLQVTAVESVLGHHATSQPLEVALSNPPIAPKDVKASFSLVQQAIAVVWEPNAEGDLTGYVVDQCRAETASDHCTNWVQVATPGADVAGAVIGVTEPGAYRHRVRAVRPDAFGVPLRSVSSHAGDPIVLEFDDGSGDSESGGTGSDDSGNGDSGNGDQGGTGGTGPNGSENGGNDTPVQAAPGTFEREELGERARSGGNGSPATGTRREIEPRLIQRAPNDGTFGEFLPYGASRPEEVAQAPRSLLSSETGPALALVPIAGGLLLFVFSMQLRVLNRRAALAIDRGEGDVGRSEGDDGGSGDGPVGSGEPTGGSFITDWRRWLDPGDGNPLG